MGTGRRNFCFLFPSELQIFVKGGKVKPVKPRREEKSCFYFKTNLKPSIKLDFKVFLLFVFGRLRRATSTKRFVPLLNQIARV